ncbi:MAG: AAA family ATPase [Casimicrobiaceae bacterium]
MTGARTIIQERRERGLSARPNAHEFAQEVLRKGVNNYAGHAATSGHVFFDRSVLDALGMLDGVTPFSESVLNAWLSPYQYNSKVFLFPPWKAIYVNDAERDHTFAHVEAVHRGVQEWYRRCHYELLEVPRVSFSERCSYVLQALESGDA